MLGLRLPFATRSFAFGRLKYKTPRLLMKNIKPVPAPGYNLELPDWTPEEFCKRIGGDCDEYAEKFETLEEIFSMNKYEMKAKGVPPHQRRYIFRVKNMLRQGVLTFDYLGKRTCLDRVRD